MGSAILGSTGYVSYSQADSLFQAGEGLAKAAQSLTPEEEYYLGRSVSAMILAKYTPSRDAKLNQYVNRIGQIIARVSDRPETFNGYRFMVLDTPEINGFAAPGGFIFVTRGLIALCSSEEDLAGVIAHEVAHVVNGDGLKAISQANLTNALAILGREAASTAISQAGAPEIGALTSAFGGSVTDVFKTMATDGYSRSQEYAADEYAITLLRRAGYNPRGLSNVLAKLEKVKGEGGFFETHPSASDRLDEVSDVVKKDTDGPIVGEPVRGKRFSKNVRS
jgi:predicted Zn-dependent protease